MTKHGVVTLSETLHQELALLGSRLRVSVLCPGFVSTRIIDSARHRPAAAAGFSQTEQMGRQLIAAGLAPAVVADCVFEAIRAERNPTPPNPQALLERLRPQG
jgi:short-subunit dehydrogenase